MTLMRPTDLWEILLPISTASSVNPSGHALPILSKQEGIPPR